MSGYSMGLVLNPKLNEPLFCTYSDDVVNLLSLKNAKIIGYGAYENSETSDYFFPAEISGYPRAHVPQGVNPRGKGYGTCLYTSLCLGAHLDVEDLLATDSPVEGDGISSSSSTRSREADAWWSRARKLHLTGTTEGTATVEDVDLDTDEVGDCIIETIVEPGQEIEVTSATGTVTKEVQIDTYEYDDATGHDLILSTFPDVLAQSEVTLFDNMRRAFRNNMPVGERKIQQYERFIRKFWQYLSKHPHSLEGRETFVKPLAACDVRGLLPDALNLIVVLLRLEDADEDFVDALITRAKYNIDPESLKRSKQLRFKFKQNASPELKEAVGIAEELRRNLHWKELRSLP